MLSCKQRSAQSAGRRGKIASKSVHVSGRFVKSVIRYGTVEYTEPTFFSFDKTSCLIRFRDTSTNQCHPASSDQRIMTARDAMQDRALARNFRLEPTFVKLGDDGRSHFSGSLSLVRDRIKSEIPRTGGIQAARCRAWRPPSANPGSRGGTREGAGRL